MNGVNLATVFNQAAKMDAEKVFSGMLGFFARRIQETDLDGRQLANVLYGCQRMDDGTPGVQELLVALTSKAADTRMRSQLTPQAVSNCLYGLQRFSSGLPEVRGLLFALSELFNGLDCRLSCQGVGTAFYGLQGFDSSCMETAALLRALRPLLSRSDLDGQAVGNALYGLQSMSSDSLEVRHLLRVFAQKLVAFKGCFTEQEASNAVYGLQFMDSQLPEVKAILEVLAKRVTDSGTAGLNRHRQRSRHPVNPLSGRGAEPRLHPDFLGTVFDLKLECPYEWPYLVDVGCDMGGFACGVARARPDLRVVGLEMRAHAVAFARTRAREMGLRNVAFAEGNANVDLISLLQQIQENGELVTVTLNFPDPHLLPEHRERRLVRGSLVRVLAQHLQPGKEVLFQSDVALLADEAREAFNLAGCFKVVNWLPREDFVDTERQRVVRQSGLPVHKVRLVRTASGVPTTLEEDVDRILARMRGPEALQMAAGACGT